MSSTGLIFLYHKDGEIASVQKYYNRTDRVNIIEGWKKKYAKAYDNTFLQISPDVHDEIKMDGTNALPRKRTRQVAKNKLLTFQ